MDHPVLIYNLFLTYLDHLAHSYIHRLLGFHYLHPSLSHQHQFEVQFGYQSRLLAKAWISQCFHYSDLNRILDPLLIQLLHPSSARKLALPQAYIPPEPEDSHSVHSREAEDAHALNTRTKLSVFSEEGSEAEYSTAESEMTVESEGVKEGEEKKRTDCQNELFYSQEYDTHRSKYLWQIILSMMQADPTPFIR